MFTICLLSTLGIVRIAACNFLVLNCHLLQLLWMRSPFDTSATVLSPYLRVMLRDVQACSHPKELYLDYFLGSHCENCFCNFWAQQCRRGSWILFKAHSWFGVFQKASPPITPWCISSVPGTAPEGVLALFYALPNFNINFRKPPDLEEAVWPLCVRHCDVTWCTWQN